MTAPVSTRPASALLTLLAAGLLAALPLPAAATPPLKLHVPSPDWRDQVLYFVMTDRFDDGDPANNDQGAGEYDPAQRGRYSGGDLRGLLRRLDYIRGLGATGLWLTPPVANQWVDPWANYTGYHGYWAEDFTRVDAHLGTLADYQRLSDGLHRRGMVLVQDIVVNHTGNFFRYRGGWDEADPARFYERNTATQPVAAPTQPPFDRNDPRDPAQRAAGIYHWTPDVADYGQRRQELDFQMSGLDDLNTENPAVRRALRASFGHWIRSVGVDAFRVDTAFYVPPEFFADFLHARDPQAPGIATVARRTGRRDFHVFGEGFGIDRPYQDVQAQKIERYMTAADGKPLLPGMLNFPLYGALGDVFARGRPPAELGHRITRTMQLHARPHRMPSFIDNHDVDRFLAGGSRAGLRQALLAMLTLPGIPVIYYGTEQGFTQQRASMFAAGWGSGGRDHFDTAAPLYRDIAAMTALRREHRLFSRGTPTVLQANAAQAGVLAYTMAHAGRRALVVFNSADTPSLLAGLDSGLPAGSLLQGLYGLDGRPADLVVGAEGRVTLALPPRAGQVWLLGPPGTGAAAATSAATAPPAALHIEPLPPAATGTAPAGTVTGDFTVRGQATGVRRLRLVVDGDIDAATDVQPDAQGRWQATVDTARMIDPATPHSVVAWAEGGAASAPLVFRVARAWQPLADVADPAGDDAGPAGRYLYPSDPGWGENRQMDLRRVQVAGAGGALKIDLTTHRISTSWSPANGFDHVAFTVYIELPGEPGGARVMPLQNAELPEGMRWHRRLRVHGWSNALFSAEGASATHEGTAITPAAGIEVNRETNTVSLVLPALALGRPATLRGAKVYVTTWDYDGGYRALNPQPQGHAMGGGTPAEPKVMDDSGVIVLP